MPARLYLLGGITGRIDCPVEANPPVVRIMWTRNESMLDDVTKSSRVSLGKYGTLVLRTVRRDDEGRYACLPYSSLGMGEISSTVNVYVRGAVVFLLQYKFMSEILFFLQIHAGNLVFVVFHAGIV